MNTPLPRLYFKPSNRQINRTLTIMTNSRAGPESPPGSSWSLAVFASPQPSASSCCWHPARSFTPQYKRPLVYFVRNVTVMADARVPLDLIRSVDTGLRGNCRNAGPGRCRAGRPAAQDRSPRLRPRRTRHLAQGEVHGHGDLRGNREPVAQVPSLSTARPTIPDGRLRRWLKKSRRVSAIAFSLATPRVRKSFPPRTTIPPDWPRIRPRSSCRPAGCNASCRLRVAKSRPGKAGRGGRAARAGPTCAQGDGSASCCRSTTDPCFIPGATGAPRC